MMSTEIKVASRNVLKLYDEKAFSNAVKFCKIRNVPKSFSYIGFFFRECCFLLHRLKIRKKNTSFIQLLHIYSNQQALQLS